MVLRLLLLLLCLHVLAREDSDPYIVHMDRAKVEALNTTLGSSEMWYESIIDSITVSQVVTMPQPKILYVYKNVFTGFSAKLSEKSVERLKNVDGFLSATKDEMLTLHTTHSPHFLGLQEGRGLWDAQNLASDVIVGVVDTGIWPEHPSFGSSGVLRVPSHWKGKCQRGIKCNGKLIGAWAFFKGYESIAGRINETLDYRSPRDAAGHGTHTASTSGGNFVKGANLFGLAKGSASGMRPTARIAVYKACFQLGCASSDILAAVERAVSDGVDVLSLSLGGVAREFYADKMAIAAFGAIKKGVFVTFSAGNSGPRESTVANIAPWMMTVAASYTDRQFPAELRLGDGRSFIGASLYVGKPTGPLPLAYGDTAGGGAARFCVANTLSSKMVKGKIVVCDRGINGRVAKGEQVKKAGGIGMVLANTDSQGEELFADPHLLPAVTIGASAAQMLKLYLNATANATASLKFDGTTFNNPAPIMAAFSSRGPSVIDPNVIKPDVTAPGVNILAAWPRIVSPSEIKSDNRRVLFNIVSGTSMSCPHVAGLAALLKSRHPHWSPAAIKSALMTTAYSPIAEAAGPGSKPATPYAYGSGHVDPEKAADPGLIYDIGTSDYLLYLCSLNYNSTQMALFDKFTCPGRSYFEAGDLNYPSFAVTLSKSGSGNGSTRTVKRTVTNVGVPVSGYAVEVKEPEGVKVSVEPKVLQFRRLGEQLMYRVRFAAAAAGGSGGGNFSFGAVVWRSGKYSVRSPIAVTWI